MTDNTFNLPPKLEAYLERINAEVRNFRRFVVKREGRDHYHYDAVVIRIVKGRIVCDDEDCAPTKQERSDIEQEIEQETAQGKWPNNIPAGGTELLRDLLRKKGEHNPRLFEFRELDGGIRLVQQRIETVNGKADLPWSFWSDGKWRCMEPDGDLPLWGLEKLKTATTVFLHEGAKGAAVLSDPAFLQGHPWADELTGYGVAHLGWPGGAPNPHRVDWGPIRKLPPRAWVIIVCDNDISGENAASKISKIIKRRCWAIRFGEAFPKNFDLADPFPAEFWKEKRGQPVYDGPGYSDCLVSATWATRRLGDGDRYELREEFEEDWYAVVRPTVFVHREHPERQYLENEFNARCKPFSDVSNVAALLRGSLRAQADGLVYEPGKKTGRIAFEGKQVVNVFRPSQIKPAETYTAGAARPWLDFMEHLIPEQEELANALKWIATLIARPDVHMSYGMLLISESQGIGKTTLGEKILAPLVGWSNCSSPSPNEMQGKFSSWRIFKRLAIIAELYTGHSSKVYNDLKTIITDRMVRVEEKYEKPYDIANHMHLLASSNSMKALKLDDGDRRWFVPRVTEKKKDFAYWKSLNEWLGDGGLEIIACWARKYVDEHGAEQDGREAPMSLRKREMIIEGYSDGERSVSQLGDQFSKLHGPMVMRLDHVRVWLAGKKGREQPRQFGDDGMNMLERPETISKVLRGCGLNSPRRQFKSKADQFRIVANFEIDSQVRWGGLQALLVSPVTVYALVSPEDDGII